MGEGRGADCVLREQTFMQGMVDNEGGITGRLNYGWSPANTTKASVQVRAFPLHFLRQNVR